MYDFFLGFIALWIFILFDQILTIFFFHLIVQHHIFLNTFDIQNHAGEGEAGDEATHLCRPALDWLSSLLPKNHLRTGFYVAHDLKTHDGWQLWKGKNKVDVKVSGQLNLKNIYI